MLGSIAGDIIGSPFEHKEKVSPDFPLFGESCRFTDDTVLTVASCKAILDNLPYKETYLDFAKRYPDRGYGKMFTAWFKSIIPVPYNSWGNGSAMRVSPIAYAFDFEESLEQARISAEVTHNHLEGIRGAQATVAAVFIAKSKIEKSFMKKTIVKYFYPVIEGVVLPEECKRDVSCMKLVPQSIEVFLNSKNFEDVIRASVNLGGDTDTRACIAGGIAEAYYGIPDNIVEEVMKRIPDEFKDILIRFYKKYLKKEIQ
jgi:ADP-ribosylglycohydrolase